MFDILFLGTGASVPSRNYGLPSVVLRRGDDMIMLDCGEGTQRQMMVSPFSFMKLSAIFVTHLHGDHFYGLPGLIQTMSMNGRSEPLVLRGPEGFSDALQTILSVCPAELTFGIDSRDMAPGDCETVGELSISCFATDHGVPSIGFVVREPATRGNFDGAKAAELGISGDDFSLLEAGETVRGVTLSDVCGPANHGKSVAYTGDTHRCATADEALRDVDILIHESTYMDAQSDKADEFRHSTALSAAETARDCGCKTLFLIHISSRYKDRTKILEEAKRVFKYVYVPDDLALFRTTKNGIRSA